jgi:DNA-binding IclR family transcriptional regulator
MAVPSKTTILKTTDKVFTILDFLMREKKAFAIKELSEIFGIPPSTIYRILTTLKERNYVVQDPHTKNYRISYALLAFFHALSFDSLLLSYQGHLKLKELALRTGFTASLSVKEEYRAYYVDRVEPPDNIKLATQVGAEVPLHTSASGKIILAYLDPQEREIFLRLHPLTPYTSKTITSLQELERELEKIRQANGIAWDLEETQKGIFCIGAPIFLPQERILGAVAIGGPLFLLEENKIDFYIEKVRTTAQWFTEQCKGVHFLEGR